MGLKVLAAKVVGESVGESGAVERRWGGGRACLSAIGMVSFG